LSNQYRDKAKKWAQDNWKELKERNLTADLDSAKTVSQITNYNLNKWILSDRYGNNKPKASTSITTPPTEEPTALKTLRTARRYNNPIPEKKAAATFAW
jgi:hypothetical protein